MIPNTRQTLTFLRTLFEERGIRPKNKLGQNFLIDINLIDVIVREADLGPADLVLEVGSGTGGLTLRLVEKAGAVVSVEIDTPFAEIIRDAVDHHYRMFANTPTVTAPRDRVHLLHRDVLAGKNRLSPELMETMAACLAQPGIEKVKLVANLPYAVAVPVIMNLLLTDLPVERMVGMVQWEIAERLVAQPGTKEYAALAVLAQSLCDVSIVRKVAPTNFWPRPLVDSAIVMLKPDPARRAHVGDVKAFRNFLRDLYVHRRKALRAALSGLPSGKVAKSEVDARLAKLGIDGTRRAETLDLEQHLLLSRAFQVEAVDDGRDEDVDEGGDESGGEREEG